MSTAYMWRLFLLALGLLAVPVVLHAQLEDRLIGAEEIIGRATTLAAQKDYSGAIGLLKPAINRYPMYLRLYTTLADLQEQAGIEKLSAPAGTGNGNTTGNPASTGQTTPGATNMPPAGGAVNGRQAGANPSGPTTVSKNDRASMDRRRGMLARGGGQQPPQGAMQNPPPGAPGGPGSSAAGPFGTPAQNTRVMATREQLLQSPEVAQDLFETLGKGMMYLRDATEVRQRANELIAINFPTRLGPYGILTLPGGPAVFSYSLNDTRLPEEERGIQQGLVNSRPLAPVDALLRDPKFGKDAKYSRDPGWSFPNMLYAYALDRNSQTWQLRFRIMWQNAPGQEDARAVLAQQTAQLLLRLYGTVRAYTGFTPRFTDKGVVNVWLTENGEAGGEAYNENIYIYKVGVQRSGMEWAREIAHEYGHLTLPIVTGYTLPEASATGTLGERLFMRWLAINRDVTNDAHAWVRAIDAETLREQKINPLINQYANVGPYAPVLGGNSAESMDRFVGMALYLEAMRGSRFLAGVLSEMRTPRYTGAEGFLQSLESLEKYAQGYPVVYLRLRDLPQDIPYHTFLTTGTWLGELQGSDLQVNKLKLTIDGVKIPVAENGKFSLVEIPTGWHILRIIPVGNAQQPDINMIKLSRQ